MKYQYFILIILLLFAGCSDIKNTNKSVNENYKNQEKVDQNKINNIARDDNVENLEFDIDLSSLKYKLPDFDIICLPEQKYFCSNEGCNRKKASVFLLYKKYSNLLYRCDRQPCDKYEVNEYPSGMFTYLRPKDAKELSVKIANDSIVDDIVPEIKNEYIELAGMGLAVMISNGSCINKMELN